MPNADPTYEHLAFVIPCYNCGDTVISVANVCKTVTNNILLVNDGSTDETSEIINQLAYEKISWEQNQGKGVALREGFKYWLSNDDWNVLITLDSDGQHDPKEIQNFLDIYQETNADLVLGARRFNRNEMPALRYWANTLSSKFISFITGCNVHDLQCGYRLFTRNTLEKILPTLTSGTYSIETEMALTAHRMGLRIEEVEVSLIYLPSATQSSSWKPISDSWNIACVVAKHMFQQKEK